MDKYEITIHTDGGARGNPGPAAIGAVISITAPDKTQRIRNISRFIGKTTNNVAEYQALVAALELITSELGESPAQITVFLDSLLVVNQVNGLFKVKDANLRNYLLKVRELESFLNGPVTYAYVPREKNTAADALVNQALDSSV